MPFGDLLFAAMNSHGPLCLGVDPHAGLLKDWGLNDSVQGVAKFTEIVVEAAVGRVAALKPQVAFFERFGSAGFSVLEDLLFEARRNNLLVISDAKRGDIGSTMAAYAEGWLAPHSPLSSDALTVSPYLGFESLRPALDLAAQNSRGTFVLALTSNSEGKTVQHVGGSESVAGDIIRQAREENSSRTWQKMGPCGLVIGATVGGALKKLDIDLSTFNGPILAPGYGAQGATADDLYGVFAGVEENVLVNSSRGVLQHGPSLEGLIDAIESCTEDLRASFSPA